MPGSPAQGRTDDSTAPTTTPTIQENTPPGFPDGAILDHQSS